jgi:hypothetical protein
MLVFEALRAKYGDSLLLHYGSAGEPRLAVIDGGPPGVYNDALRPRLEEIRKKRKLKDTTPLDIDLMMVSHIDQDHIAGILQLVRKMKDLRDSQQPVPWKIKRFWHNSFDDILDNDDISVASPASVMSPASIGGLLGHTGSLILASVGEGRELRKLLDALNLDGNQPFGGLVRTGSGEVVLGNLKLTVVAPSDENLRRSGTNRSSRSSKRRRTRPAARRSPPISTNRSPTSPASWCWPRRTASASSSPATAAATTRSKVWSRPASSTTRAGSRWTS